MKNFSRLQRIISVLLIFIILIQITGCVTTSPLADSVLPISGKYYYTIHGVSTSYLLEKAIISNDTLSGKIITDQSAHAGNMIHVYLKSDSQMKINPDKTISVPVNAVSKTEMSKVNPGRTVLVLTGCTIGFILIIGVIALNTNPFSIGL